MASFQSGFLLGIIKADSSGNIIKSKMFLSYKKRLLDTSIKQRTINEDLIVSGGYYDSISNNRGYYIFRLDSGLNQLSGFTFYSDSITSATRLHLELFADDKLAFCANEYLVQHFYRLALLLLQNSNLNVSQLCNIAPLILSSTTIVLPSSDIELNDTLITSYPIYSFYNSTTVPDTLIDSTLCLITGIEENAVHENKFVSVSPNPSYDILIIKIQKNSPGKTAFILRNATSEILINEETELNGSFSKTLNIQSIPSGIYFLEVTSKFFKEQFKIVKL